MLNVLNTGSKKINRCDRKCQHTAHPIDDDKVNCGKISTTIIAASPSASPLTETLVLCLSPNLSQEGTFPF